MSMIEPGEPTMNFSYEDINYQNKVRYVKSSKNKVFKIKLNEIITAHIVGGSRNKTKYIKYSIYRNVFTESSFKRFRNKVFNKQNLTKSFWEKIDYRLYSKDFYSFFSPEGLVLEDSIYMTYNDALNGKVSHTFRSFNYKDEK